MDFKTATDKLAECPTHEDVARAIGVSVQTVRQARMEADAAGSRPAPAGWRRAVAKIARERAAELVKLAEKLEV